MKPKSRLMIGLALPVSAAMLHTYTGGHLDGPAFGYVSVAKQAEFSTTSLNSRNYDRLSQDETDATNNGALFLGIGIEELNPAD